MGKVGEVGGCSAAQRCFVCAPRRCMHTIILLPQRSGYSQQGLLHNTIHTNCVIQSHTKSVRNTSTKCCAVAFLQRKG